VVGAPRAWRVRGGPPLRRVTATVTAAAALLVGAAACGGSDYRWVTNGSQGNFFKVPSAWDYDVITSSQNQGRPEALPGSITPVWHVYFDSAKGTPTPEGPEDLPTDLIGNAQIFSLSNYYRENYSVSSVREQLFHGIDPVYPPDDLQGRVELVSYRPIEDAEGLTGSRVVANINLSEDGGERWLTVDGSMLFDSRTGRIFALTMECTSECYELNRSAADQIAASWKVNEP
jgi:hypothetical protein